MVSGGKDPFDLVAGTADVVVTMVIISNTVLENSGLCLIVGKLCIVLFRPAPTTSSFPSRTRTRTGDAATFSGQSTRTPSSPWSLVSLAIMRTCLQIYSLKKARGRARQRPLKSIIASCGVI